MIESITIAYKHPSASDKNPRMEVLAGTDKPASEQKAMIREKFSGTVNPTYALIERWESGSGVIFSRKFETPQAAKIREEQAKKFAEINAKRAQQPDTRNPRLPVNAKTEPKAKQPTVAPAPVQPKPESTK